MHWSSGHAVSNGVAYWIMRAENYSLHLVSFDTGSEVFEKVLLPEAIWNGLGFDDIHAYWIMGAEKDYSFHLVSFDTGSEVFEKVLLPEAIWDGLQYYFGGFNDIHAYKESVCLLLPSGRDVHVDIWVLQEKCLHKLHTVWFPGRSPVPLGFKMNDELLVKYRKHGRSRCQYLAIHNLQTKQINETRFRLPLHCYLDDHVDTYVASLLLLKDIRAQELRGISSVFPLCRGRT
ncbi:hypothetical protein ACE6H2_001955 [Prunus campanulata]